MDAFDLLDLGEPLPEDVTEGLPLKAADNADKALLYAVLILRYLRCNPGRNKAEDVLAECGVPKPYGSKVITALAKRGWIHAVRGAGGGIQITKPPSDPIPVNSVRRLFKLSVFPFTEI